MNGYNESKLTDIKVIKDEFSITLFEQKQKKVFLDTKKNSKKGIRSFLPENLENTFQTKKKVFY